MKESLEPTLVKLLTVLHSPGLGLKYLTRVEVVDSHNHSRARLCNINYVFPATNTLAFSPRASITNFIKLPLLSLALTLSINVRLARKKLGSDKHSSFFVYSMNGGEERFNTSHPGPMLKIICSCNLLMFLISESVCPWQAFPA
jgi:hypothetical protein